LIDQTSEYEEKKESADVSAAPAGKDKKGAPAPAAGKDKGKGGAATAAAPVAATPPSVTFTLTALYATLPPLTAADLGFETSTASSSSTPTPTADVTSSSSSPSLNFDLARVIISTPVVELARAAWSELRHALIQSQTLAKSRLNGSAAIPDTEFITQEHQVKTAPLFSTQLMMALN
jgi:hypothetical protein